MWEPPPHGKGFVTAGDNVAWFIEQHCTHAKGEWFGQPLKLEAWQRWVLDLMFEVDPKTGLRVWRQVLWVLPRKNAKSTIIAALGYYFLVHDGEGGPEVFSAAWGEQQARNVFDAARTMHDSSPKLRASTNKFAKAITCPKNAGTWRVVSRIAETQQGTNPHAALIDELHVHQRLDLYDAFKRGTQARRQPMILTITTEGSDAEGPLGIVQRGYLATGKVEQITPFLQVVRDYDTGSLMIRWGVPWDGDDVDPEDPAVVRACNPAGWIDPKRLIAEYLKAPGNREVDFRRYHLNQLVEGDDQGIPAPVWDACKVEGVRIPDGVEADIAVDIGWRKDSSAVVATAMVEGRLAVEAHIWDAPGGGGEINLWETVDPKVDELMRRLSVRSLRIDPYSDTSLRQTWMIRGWPVTEFTQHPKHLIPASQRFLEAVESGSVAHDGSEDLRRHVLNMRMRQASTTNLDRPGWLFGKHSDSSRKSDGGRALIMSADAWLAVQGGLATVGI